MVITDKQFADNCHMLIHSVRLLSNYNPSELEKKLSRLVIEKYSDSCDECKIIGEKIKLNPPQQKKSIFGKIGEAINSVD